MIPFYDYFITHMKDLMPFKKYLKKQIVMKHFFTK